MGGSCWSYVVPYAGDVEQALRTLQAEVFANRAYFDRRQALAATLPRMRELVASLPVAPHERDKMIAEVQAKIDAPDPATIEELRTFNEESGTHSILDIEGVSAKPKVFRIAPLTTTQIRRLFGDGPPRRAQVDGVLSQLWELRQRWCGTYVLLHDGPTIDVPTEILFAGCSGD